MIDVPDWLDAPRGLVLGVLRFPWWLAWEVCVQTVGWSIGWCVLRVLTLGRYPEERLGGVDAAFVERLTRLVQAAGLPTVAPVLDVQDNLGRYLALMQVDKKSEAGEIKFVVLDRPGSAVVRGAPDALVARVIADSVRL